MFKTFRCYFFISLIADIFLLKNAREVENINIQMRISNDEL